MKTAYSLTKNRLGSSEKNAYVAQVYSNNTFSKDDFIDRILQKGTLITKSDVLAVLNAAEEVLIEVSKEGSIFNLPLFQTNFSISGVFESPLDNFDPKRHRFNINLIKGKVFRQAENLVHLEKVESPNYGLKILQVKDSASGKTNSLLASQGALEIYGHNLKIMGDSTCGLFFVSENQNSIQVQTLIENNPSKLTALVPALPVGQYYVHVVTQYSGSTLLKLPREYTFEKPLTVE